MINDMRLGTIQELHRSSNKLCKSGAIFIERFVCSSIFFSYISASFFS